MQNSQKYIDDFLEQRTIAIVGVSRNKEKFGNAIYRDLKQRGYKVLAVNPHADMVEGDRCYAGLGALPVVPGGVVVVIPSSDVIPVLEEAARAGIKYVWLQQGANSRAAEKRCEDLGLSYVSGECILMYAAPIESIHKFHRFLKKLFGQMPK